jgi:Fe-S-cluster containining protein
MGKEARVKAERRRGRVHLAVIKDVVENYKKTAIPAIDKVVAMQNAVSAELGRQHSCRRGCVGCCYQLVLIDIIEAFVIADYIIRTGMTTSELAVTVLQHAKRQTEEDRGQWFRSATPCMFLDEKTKDCRIYDVRPTPCRSYYVLGDPANCFPNAPKQDIASINSWPAIIVNRKGATEMLKAAREHIPELPEWLGVGPLPVMVLVALDAIRHGGDTIRRHIQMVKPKDYVEQTPYLHREPGDVATAADPDGERRYVSHVIARAGYDPEQFGIPRPEGFAPATGAPGADAGAVRGGVPEPAAP